MKKIITKFRKKLLTVIFCLLFTSNPFNISFSEEIETEIEKLFKEAIKIEIHAFSLKGLNQNRALKNAIKAFNEICEKGGSTNLTCAKSELHIATLYEILGEETQALDLYSSISSKYQQFRKIAALSKKSKGIILIKQGKKLKAQQEFKSIVAQYSDAKKVASDALVMVKKINTFFQRTEAPVWVLAESELFTDQTIIMAEDIHFEFKKSRLSPYALDNLMKLAEWLRANPNQIVTIEGYADDADGQGTEEYNLALGERRAYRAKASLVGLGIAPSRIATISYGEERPVATKTNEVARAKNRRVHFFIN